MKHVATWVAVAILTAYERAAAAELGSPLTATHVQFCGTDRWQSDITAASSITRLPIAWITAVMRAESAGCEQMDGTPTTSSAGAIGLMQVMPASWARMRLRYGLGTDPYSPRDNIVAGAGVLKELYDRYGPTYFIAAYHAGASRVDDWLSGARPLPVKTLEYVAHVQRALESIGATDLAALLAESKGTRTPFVRRSHGSDLPRQPPYRSRNSRLFVRRTHGAVRTGDGDSVPNRVQTR